MTTGAFPRLKRFAKLSLREKSRSIAFRAGSVKSRILQVVSTIPMPVKLPFGSWWLARNDHVGKPVREGKFETVELAFVDRFIQPGMTVLDLGAHHGLYTLLASKRVGVSGKVFAFEPSPRERRFLHHHLMLNRCRNVIVERFALGNQDVETDFYVVEDWAAGCNSLQPPDVHASTSCVRVEVARLDDWLAKQKIVNVEFIKLDVEGAELDALRGAEALLSRAPRPVILAEVQDIRTEPWGYRAKEIIEYLLQRRFQWFSITAAGSLQKLDVTREKFDGNFVAIPQEFDMAQVRAKLF